MTKRKQHTKEFKLDAVSLVTEQGYSRAEATRAAELQQQHAGTLGKRVGECSRSVFPQ